MALPKHFIPLMSTELWLLLMSNGTYAKFIANKIIIYWHNWIFLRRSKIIKVYFKNV